MKYICTVNDEEDEEIFIFPKDVDHDAMMEVVNYLKNQTWGNWRRVRRHVVSAGFVDKDLNCYGESVSLDVKSRGDEDTELLKKQFAA